VSVELSTELPDEIGDGDLMLTETLSKVDIAWLAGLLEGEGSFMRGKRKDAPGISLAMTDRDVVERAAKLLRTKCMGPLSK
jgi:hypothetical protein